MELAAIEPATPLRSFIKRYLVQELDVPGGQVSVPAWSQNFIFFQYGDLFDMRRMDGRVIHGSHVMVTGCMTQATRFVQPLTHVRAIVAELQPLVLFDLLGESMERATDTSLDATVHLQGAGEALDAVRTATTPRARAALLDDFFLGLFANYRSTVHPAVTELYRRIDMQPEEPLKLGGFTQNFAISERHLRRLFVRQVGVVPKMLHRLRRMEAILATVHGAGAREVTCYLTGFADQAHFAREFRRLTGRRLRDFIGDLEDPTSKAVLNNLS